MTKDAKTAVLMARIGGAHGIRGEVRAQAFTADPLAVGDYGPLRDASGRVFEILSVKSAKSVVILKLKGVVDRDAAEALNGTELFIDRDDLPDDALDEDEFYQNDLIGLQAIDAEGKAHGSVVAVHDFGAGIVLELEQAGRRSVMIPFSEAAVPDIDVEAGRLIVDPVAAGLVDDEEAPAGKSRPGSRRRKPPRGASGTGAP
jgi:16S rRNA processing protein RimM